VAEQCGDDAHDGDGRPVGEGAAAGARVVFGDEDAGDDEDGDEQPDRPAEQEEDRRVTLEHEIRSRHVPPMVQANPVIVQPAP
jgi:hypothetical protein